MSMPTTLPSASKSMTKPSAISRDANLLARAILVTEDGRVEDLGAVELLLLGEPEQQRPRIPRGMRGDDHAALRVHLVGDRRERHRGVDAPLDAERAYREGLRELGELRRSTFFCTDWFRSQFYYDSGTWRATWGGAHPVGWTGTHPAATMSEERAQVKTRLAMRPGQFLGSRNVAAG